MTDVSDNNAAVARKLWDAASTGDPSAVLAFHPKIVWKVWGHGANAGEHHGLDEVLQFLARANDFFDDVRSELIDILSSQRGAVILYRNIMTRGHKRLDRPYSLWLRIEEGVVVEASAVPFEDAGDAAFWRVD